MNNVSAETLTCYWADDTFGN